MSAHTCTTLTRGCYRCDLNIDEMRTIKRKDYRVRTRLWGRCEGCGCKWQWGGKTTDVRNGLQTIARSGCLCYGDGKLR